MVVEKLTACLFLVLVTVDTGITLWEMYCIENLFEEPILKQICRFFSAILNKKSFKQMFILRLYEKEYSACFTWLWASDLRPKFFRFLLVFKIFIRGLHKFYVLKTLPQQAHQRYPVQTSNQSFTFLSLIFATVTLDCMIANFFVGLKGGLAAGQSVYVGRFGRFLEVGLGGS